MEVEVEVDVEVDVVVDIENVVEIEGDVAVVVVDERENDEPSAGRQWAWAETRNGAEHFD